MIESCIHLANLFYLASFLCLDMFWLRVLTCAGLSCGVVYFAFQPTPLYSCTIWQMIFLAVNFVQIRRLVLARRRLTLSDEQRQIGEAAFRDLSRDELITLLARTMCAPLPPAKAIETLPRRPLTEEERALRDIAFSRLSRKELLNLLVRRLWNSLKRRNPANWIRKLRMVRAAAVSAQKGRLA